MRDSGRSRGLTESVGTSAIIVAVATMLWTVFYYSNFTHLWAADAMKYAEAARNFIAGKGFVMGEVWPLHVASGHPIYAQANAVLHPLVLAALFKIAGQSDGVVAAASGIFFVLSAPLVYWLTKRLFGLTASFLALALFLAEPWMLYYSVSGLTEPLFMFLLLCVFLVLSSEKESRMNARFFLAGAFLGLSQLARPVGFVLLAPTAVFCCAEAQGRRRRAAAVIALMGGFLVPVLASHVLVAALGEAPFERNTFHLISQTPVHPGHTYVRTVVPLSFWDELRARPGMYFLKWLEQLAEVNRHFFHVFASPLVVALLLAFPLVWGRRGKALRLFFLLGGFFLAQAALSAITFHNYRYLHPFLPLALPFACASLDTGTRGFLQGHGRLRVVVLVVVAVWASYPFAYSAPMDRGGIVSRTYSEIVRAKDFTSLGEFIRANIGEDDVILCDAPWLAAWYGDRMAIWLPNSPVDVAALRERVRISWLLLTAEYPLPVKWQRLFERILDERRGAGWDFVKGFEKGRTSGYLFRAVPPDSSAAQAR